MVRSHRYPLQSCLTLSRDSEESAPAEYPPDQPEADQVDDGATYGQEEVELEEGLKAELAAEEAKAAAEGEDEEMEGADDTAGAKDNDSDAGSEDLEAESSDDDEDDEEEAEGEEGADEDMEMADGDAPPHDGKKDGVSQQHGEVMVH